MESQDHEKPAYAIGEVAGRLGVSVETIRLYERHGLVVISKSESGQRIYSESDIERLKCVRIAINEHKISIEGIRRMQSLVPCWSHIQCPEEQRVKCPAFLRESGGCWTYKHDGNECAELDCRECKVYRLSGACENIKSLIYRDMLPSQENHRQQENEL
jgi:MerR family transcriptional regulator, heat shock protein HspR